MKRLILILLPLTLLLFACGGQDAPEASASAPASTAAPEASEGTEAPAQTAAVLVKITYMDENGAEIRHIEYDYDASGFCTAQREVSAQGEISWEQKHTAGDNGKTALTEDYADGRMTGYTLYTYDSAGQLIQEDLYEGSEILQSTQYAYDSQGNPSQIQLTADGITQDWGFVRTYDEGGNVLTLEERLNGEVVSRTEMTYDQAGRCTLTVVYAADGTLTSRTESLWEDATETRFYYDADDIACQTSVITYDGSGNVTFQEDTYAGGSVSMTEYTYATIEILK